MKRRWNLPIWAGTLVLVAVAVTFFPLIDRFPDYRDNPWSTLLVEVAGCALIVFGAARAYRDPAAWRGRVAGTILGILALGFTGLFVFGSLVEARNIPPSGGAPQVGQKAPDFTLPDAAGRPVALSDLLASAAHPEGGSVLLIFYRGYW